MVVLAAVLSLCIGVALGVLGGGGSILTLPLLIYVLGVDARHSIPMALVVVGITALAGFLAHARAGRVQWRAGAAFGSAGLAGAWLGGAGARFVPAEILLGASGLLMLAAGGAMLRGTRGDRMGNPLPISLPRMLAAGASIGAVSGLVGAGGGFLLVPALHLFAGLAMPVAVGTSLLVITLQSFAGLLGHAAHTALDWPLAFVLSAAAATGSLLGVRLGRHIAASSLRRQFAWFVLAMGLLLLLRHLPAFAATALGGVACLAGCVRLARLRRERSTARAAA